MVGRETENSASSCLLKGSQSSCLLKGRGGLSWRGAASESRVQARKGNYHECIKAGSPRTTASTGPGSVGHTYTSI